MQMLGRRQFLATASATLFSALTGCAGRRGKAAQARIVVVGGGYGGATAAKYLKQLAPYLDVVLIDRRRTYWSCPGSNEVIAGLRPFHWLSRSYDALAERYGVQIVQAEVSAVDLERRSLRVSAGRMLPFDRVILSPGIDFRWDAYPGYDQNASRIAPHAWQAGPQTELLRRQLAAMRPGGTVLIVAPPNPYRCPPGPYERASLIAAYCQNHNRRAKILVLDAKPKFSKQAQFLKSWQDLYPGMIEWLPVSELGEVEFIDAARREVRTEFGRHRADVLNVIPPQKAALLAEQTGLTDESGWCPVDARSFVSAKHPNAHVIGDACIASPMPKSAFAANSQAKVCAAAIVDLFSGREPGPPSLINHCYSFVSDAQAISITGVYEYSSVEKGLVATATGETPLDGDRTLEAKYARSWQQNFAGDVFE